ncbi:unnamed protein product (mitochondrion) [Plasmodiophora brassicae]|uniref:Uncharacterized protein n=1 Tax=Plasmodiophora brassicae TaxID=37360 RepID=A0A3P3YB85_PLABS|nr:unnamed protein product [Plasmodiophora brassicae]
MDCSDALDWRLPDGAQQFWLVMDELTASSDFVALSIVKACVNDPTARMAFVSFQEPRSHYDAILHRTGVKWDSDRLLFIDGLSDQDVWDSPEMFPVSDVVDFVRLLLDECIGVVFCVRSDISAHAGAIACLQDIADVSVRVCPLATGYNPNIDGQLRISRRPNFCHPPTNPSPVHFRRSDTEVTVFTRGSLFQ